MKLAAIFSDNMILQRDKEVKIFGESEKKETIKVSIDNTEISQTVEAGAWTIGLPAHKAGGPYTLTVKGEDSEKIIENVLYGEVWLANGQSNIELELQNAKGGADELEAADYGDIRYFNVIKAPVIDEDMLEHEKSLVWHSCKNGDFRDMSAIGYFYAVRLRARLGVPVGIVDCYQGGTSITCWLGEDILSSCDEGRVYLENYHQQIDGQTEEEYDKKLADYNALVDRYCKIADEMKAEKPDVTPQEIDRKAGPYPWPPPMGTRSLFRPFGLYNTMIKRIIPFTVKGILYYQGEEDAARSNLYTALLEKLAAQYRRDWNEELPMVIVQLPMFIGSDAVTDERDWGFQRQAQENAVKNLTSAKLVSLIDLGEYDNIHPVDKLTPGNRIADTVLEWLYGVEGASDMELNSIEKKPELITLKFQNTYGGVKLISNELFDLRKETETDEAVTDRKSWKEGHIYGLEVSADGENWVVPEAEISGENLVIKVDADKVHFIRYGFFNYGRVNVYNEKEMPLRPFAVEV